MTDKVKYSEAQWREKLSAEQYRVAREKGTEPAFSGALWDEHREGSYHCVGCGLALFDSNAKFDSGSGWPSYFQPLDETRIGTSDDRSLFMRRVEVHCARCGSHLGHLFPDGPPPTGQRYCVNSASLTFQPASETTD